MQAGATANIAKPASRSTDHPVLADAHAFEAYRRVANAVQSARNYWSLVRIPPPRYCLGVLGGYQAGYQVKIIR